MKHFIIDFIQNEEYDTDSSVAFIWIIPMLLIYLLIEIIKINTCPAENYKYRIRNYK